FEPYPADKTVYKNTRLMEFETPANKDGLGTSTRLRKDSIPIQGMAKLKVWFRPAAPIFICWRSALRPIRRIWRARSSATPSTPSMGRTGPDDGLARVAPPRPA